METQWSVISPTLSTMDCISFLTFLLSFFTTIHSAQSSKLPYQPNILFILADDLGYGDVGVYSVYPSDNSHAKISTPRLNHFATESMRFTDAYAGAPVCAPSRCSLLTGKHSGHCSVRENGQYLQSTDISVANILSEYGNYETAMFGKWGVGNNTDPTAVNNPPKMGFDYWTGQLDQTACHNYYPYLMYEDLEAIYITENEYASVDNCISPNYLECVWTGDYWTQTAMNWLETKKDSTTPWFAYLSFTVPHAGSVGNNNENDVPVPRVTSGPYYYDYNGTWPKVEIDFATAVWELDALIGDVLDALDTYGMSNNTIVFFTSDNGAHNEGGHKYTYFASSGPLSGYKRSLKEGGHRADLMVRWPGFIEAGSVSDWQWTFYDFMATAADIAGISNSSVPENDGVSMLATLLGNTQSYNEREYVYHEYCQPNEDSSGWGMAVRIENYTGLCIGNQPKNKSDIPYGVCNSTTFQLYDLTTDIKQTTNIADSNEDVVNQMFSIMETQHETGHYCTGA